ncbi:hypothetical protein [Streptomyces sp. LaPpAH-108]|uniref:hypothetical protein n=1 Tax=Streptomyces sp. LaPpAH-108 TaxID=1155714 RepID=UPI0003648762|nr:hypothetical protein [Streptomyces sp. LaPpAH-108]
MDVVYLSERELRALAEMDKTLGREPFLIRHLRGRRLAVWVSVLAFVSFCLLALDVVFRDPLLTGAFMAVWAVTLTGLVGLVVRWSHRWKRQVTIRI